MLILSFKNIHYLPFINTIVMPLVLEKIPLTIRTAIENYPNYNPISYRQRWFLRLPIH